MNVIDNGRVYCVFFFYNLFGGDIIIILIKMCFFKKFVFEAIENKIFKYARSQLVNDPKLVNTICVVQNWLVMHKIGYQ